MPTTAMVIAPMSSSSPSPSSSISTSSDTPAVAARRERGAATLVQQLVNWVAQRVADNVFRVGMRMPSIRELAQSKQVSRFTVVEAYERLVAQGVLESRRGSGFYVRPPLPQAHLQQMGRPHQTSSPAIDIGWLMRSMHEMNRPEQGPGLGVLPASWLNGELISSALRSLGRQNGGQFLTTGSQQGFLPLRQQLQQRLAELEIGASTEQILTTSGIAQSLDLIAGRYLQVGDVVMVGDPAWFSMFARFAAQGIRMVGMSYTPQGIDVAALAQRMEQHRPKLLVINSVLHNPTGTSLTAAQAFQILQLAEQYDCLLVEDDVFGDLAPRHLAATRLASLDQLKRVIYLGSFSKTLAANLRVGYLACSVERASQLADHKMLVGLTSPEINERILLKVLSEGHYRKHVERLQQRVEHARDSAQRKLEHIGLKLFTPHGAGMLIWADTGMDANVLAAEAHEAGILLAPGSLFSPSQQASSWMRFNVATSQASATLRWLGERLQRSA